MRGSAGEFPRRRWPNGPESAVQLYFGWSAAMPMSLWESLRQFYLSSVCMIAWLIWLMQPRTGLASTSSLNPCQNGSAGRGESAWHWRIRMSREVEVYVDLDGETHLVGRLWSRVHQ